MPAPAPKAVTWQPPPQAANFQYQLGEVIKVPSQVIPGVAVYGIDGFDTPESKVRHMRSLRLYPICYMSSAYEKWRPDARDFPAAALGKAMDGWDGERWVDIRSPTIRAIAKKRMELCAAKGFPAVEFDNVDVSSVNTGFPLTAADQAAFIRYLAGTAHSLGLAYGLKNAPAMARDLVNQVDFAISEECGEFEECNLWKPFKDAGKQVFVIEYDRDAFKQLCPQAAALGVRPILKDKGLKAKPRTPCPGAL